MSSRLRELPSSALTSVGRLSAVRFLSTFLTALALAFLLTLWLAPWQQSVRGEGRVIAYAPMERQQAVESPIDGRIVRWFVQEGEEVRRGEPIAELSDNDPEILARFRRERDAARAQVDAAALSIGLTEAHISSLESANGAALSNAKLRVQMATDRRAENEQALSGAEAELRTAELNLERQQRLQERGLTSQRALELAELAERTARAKIGRAQAALRAARAEVAALGADLDEKASSNRAKIESAGSSLEKLRADKAKAEAALAQVEVKLARQEQMQVFAPQDGTLLRMLASQHAQMVKAGDAIALLVPKAGARAVELYVDGNDVPLIEEGRPVRVQFEGWPAVQFVGWPSVAVGTFGGRVAFVDAHGDAYGRFRVVVLPEEGANWPTGRYLRQGVRANGWMLLNRVSLGFELWRQLNGFPPARLDMDPDKAASGQDTVSMGDK